MSKKYYYTLTKWCEDSTKETVGIVADIELTEEEVRAMSIADEIACCDKEMADLDTAQEKIRKVLDNEKE